MAFSGAAGIITSG